MRSIAGNGMHSAQVGAAMALALLGCEVCDQAEVPHGPPMLPGAPDEEQSAEQKGPKRAKQ
eukprot:7220260-Alexandrium_andersonii.AAC.1